MNSNDLFLEENNINDLKSADLEKLEVTGETIDGLSTSDNLLAVSGTAYNGTISSTYLEFFNGYIDRFKIGTNYLIFRPDRYNYMLVYGDALTESGGRFSASEASYINVYVYDTTTVTTGMDSVNVNVGNAMVYSNIEGYSSSLKGVTHAEGLAIMVIICVSVLFNVIRSLFSRS